MRLDRLFIGEWQLPDQQTREAWRKWCWVMQQRAGFWLDRPFRLLPDLMPSFRSFKMDTYALYNQALEVMPDVWPVDASQLEMALDGMRIGGDEDYEDYED